MCCGMTSVVRTHEDRACVCFLLSSPSWFCKALLFSGCLKTPKCIFLLFLHQGHPSISLLCCMGPFVANYVAHWHSTDPEFLWSATLASPKRENFQSLQPCFFLSLSMPSILWPSWGSSLPRSDVNPEPET